MMPAFDFKSAKGKDMGQFVRCVLILLAGATSAWAQDLATVERQVEGLRAQLQEVADKEVALRERASQLEEDLKPENIQRSVAGIGTTDAEALRGQRRQQLERQKASVDAQLASLASSRSRLEAAISTAEAEAVRLRAAALAPRNTPPAQPETTATSGASVTPPAPAAKKRRNAPRASKRVRRSRPRRRATSQ
jgi:cell division protein FtsB